jgi:hypothetical protein
VARNPRALAKHLKRDGVPIAIFVGMLLREAIIIATAFEGKRRPISAPYLERIGPVFDGEASALFDHDLMGRDRRRRLSGASERALAERSPGARTGTSNCSSLRFFVKPKFPNMVDLE